MYRISSLTETIGLISPQSCCAGGEGGAGGAFGDEHADAQAPAATSQTPRARALRMRTFNVTPSLKNTPECTAAPVTNASGLARNGGSV